LRCILPFINMKNTSLRTLALTVTTYVLGLAGISPVLADSFFAIHIGSQGPPPAREDHPWARPDRSAVWIPGHNEWSNGGYVWVGGYYGYPPHAGSHWVSPSYPHDQNGYSYHPGHWSD
jgi:hypothetical protein